MNAGVKGPFGWITDGTVDFSIFFCFPKNSKNDDIIHHLVLDLQSKMDEMAVKIEQVAMKHTGNPTSAKHTLEENPSSKIHYLDGVDHVLVDMEVKFNDIKASVPVLKDIRNYAFVRPLVAYMNNNRVRILLKSRFTTSMVF